MGVDLQRPLPTGVSAVAALTDGFVAATRDGRLTFNGGDEAQLKLGEDELVVEIGVAPAPGRDILLLTSSRRLLHVTRGRVDITPEVLAVNVDSFVALSRDSAATLRDGVVSVVSRSGRATWLGAGRTLGARLVRGKTTGFVVDSKRGYELFDYRGQRVGSVDGPRSTTVIEIDGSLVIGTPDHRLGVHRVGWRVSTDTGPGLPIKLEAFLEGRVVSVAASGDRVMWATEGAPTSVGALRLPLLSPWVTASADRDKYLVGNQTGMVSQFGVNQLLVHLDDVSSTWTMATTNQYVMLGGSSGALTCESVPRPASRLALFRGPHWINCVRPEVGDRVVFVDSAGNVTRIGMRGSTSPSAERVASVSEWLNAVAPLDGGRLAVGGESGRIQVLSPAGSAERVWTAHDGWVNGLASLPGGHLASAGSDGRLVIWDSYGKPVDELAVDRSQLSSVATDGSHVVASSLSGELAVLRSNGDRFVRSVEPSRLWQVTVCGEYVGVAGSSGSSVRLISDLANVIASTLPNEVGTAVCVSRDPGMTRFEFSSRRGGRARITVSTSR